MSTESKNKNVGLVKKKKKQQRDNISVSFYEAGIHKVLSSFFKQ